jgi:seryl-tRNA synthetase
MLDIKLLEKRGDSGANYYEEYKASLTHRGAKTDLLDQVLDLNKKRKELITLAETEKAKQNKVSQEVAILKRSGQDASHLIQEMQKLVGSIKEMETKAAESEIEVNHLLSQLPNKCHASVPVGSSEQQNAVQKTVGQAKSFSFQALDHSTLGEKRNLLDFERGGKVAGARFTFLRGTLARLERSLMQFMMDTHANEGGYEEMIPPYIVNSKSLFGTGQFPKFKEDVFHLENTDYYLIPTAEVPVTNFYAGEMLKEEELPIKFAGFSPCFRSEAGNYGRDTRGLIRQHQFHKVELMMFAHPEKSYEMHERLTSDAEKILERLELPYRRMLLCTGDIGFGAAKCYDLEVWLPGAQAYREISSCSNFEDFQARRADIRFRPAGGGKPQYIHTLNGSGLAVGRTLIAVMENYQQEDGRIAVPKVLQKYMGTEWI